MRLHKDRNSLTKRREEALARNTAWTALTPKEQLKALDKRPGESKRQRRKIILTQEATKEKHV
jgi:hypothetical protein